eukprot:gene8491-5959_t
MLRKALILLRTKPSDAYHRLVQKKEISLDLNQVNALPVFDRLYDDITKYMENSKKNPPPPRQLELRPPNRLGMIPSFFLKRMQEKKVSRALSSIAGDGSASFHPLSLIKGLYVWGGVGCGKTMLMNLLYDNLPLELKKHRIHFHQFMLDVQKTSHAIKYFSEEEVIRTKRATGYLRPDNNRRSPDAQVNLFDEIAQRMIGNVELLCFDEVAVSDVADAMILKRLFTAFYRIGVVVVFTSNRPPESLYLGGLNRGGFLPFIDLVQQMNVTYHLKSETDHRLTGNRSNTYFSPFSPEQESEFNQLFLECCKGLPPSPRVLRVFGRDVRVERACGAICYFHFYELCGTEMSGADYQVIAQAFHTIFINGVPQFSYQASDVKNRFLVLVDTLYEYHCKVVLYAAVEPQQIQATRSDIYLGAGGKIDELSTQFEKEMGKQLIDESDSSFQMERCVSRLIEMRSKEYLESAHRGEEGTTATAL